MNRITLKDIELSMQYITDLFAIHGIKKEIQLYHESGIYTLYLSGNALSTGSIKECYKSLQTLRSFIHYSK